MRRIGRHLSVIELWSEMGVKSTHLQRECCIDRSYCLLMAGRENVS